MPPSLLNVIDDSGNTFLNYLKNTKLWEPNSERQDPWI